MTAPPPLPRFTLILPAGGSSTRFGSNKLLAMLRGQPVITRTLNCFIDHPMLAKVVIATSQPAEIQQACVEVLEAARQRQIPVEFVPGGPSRAESVRNALAAAPAEVEWVAIHDAARPLVSRELIDQTLAAAVQHGAATPAMPVTLTIKEAEADVLPAKVRRTLPRSTLFAIQTPQVGRRADFLAAILKCPVPLSHVTDDLQLLELAGLQTWLVRGEDRNIKLTSALDLAISERLLH